MLFEGGTVLTMKIDLPSTDPSQNTWDYELIDWVLYTLADDMLFDMLIPFIIFAFYIGSWLSRRR